MSPLSSPRASLLLPLLPILLCFLLNVGVSHGAPNPIENKPTTPELDPEPRPSPEEMKRNGKPDGGFFEDFDPDDDDDDRYVGYCIESYVRMTPGRSRKFWSYGYVYLQEAYPANCTLKYIFTTKSNPADNYATYGFQVTGSFVGPNIMYSDCSETDYITIDDTEGISQTYCGTNATIDFSTGADYFEFNFVSQENSPGALGFYVTIRSYYVCGGLITSETHGPTGIITSPNYPLSPYPANTQCTWWYTSLEESTIKLECTDFLLEDRVTFDNGTSYCPDYLSFSYEARTPDDTNYYCNGEMDERTIYSAGNNLLITFRTDSTNHYTGFSCTYDFIMFAV